MAYLPGVGAEWGVHRDVAHPRRGIGGAIVECRSSTICPKREQHNTFGHTRCQSAMANTSILLSQILSQTDVPRLLSKLLQASNKMAA